MKKVIFVCTGNTCRSPMAEGLFKAYLKNNNIDDIEVQSVGIYCNDGEAPSENAVTIAAEFGADITSHRSRRIIHNDLTDNTYFVCMTTSHRQALQQIQSDLKIITLNVSDPYGGDLDVYRSTAKEIMMRFGDIISFINAEYKISRMTERDIKEIADIERECFTLPWSEKSLEEELHNPLSRFFVARDYRRVVGYIGAFNVSGEVSLTNVAVKREYRNRGIATLLINTLERISLAENAEFITLEVRQSNETARALYEKNGFIMVGQRKGFYENPKEDAMLMTKFF